MKVFRDSLAIQAAAQNVPALSEHLTWLISEVSSDTEKDLDQLLAIVVADVSDHLTDLADVLGFDPREETVENATQLPGWFELTFIVNGEGFGYIVYVPDQPRADEELLRFCRSQVPGVEGC